MNNSLIPYNKIIKLNKNAFSTYSYLHSHDFCHDFSNFARLEFLLKEIKMAVSILIEFNKSGKNLNSNEIVDKIEKISSENTIINPLPSQPIPIPPTPSVQDPITSPPTPPTPLQDTNTLPPPPPVEDPIPLSTPPPPPVENPIPLSSPPPVQENKVLSNSAPNPPTNPLIDNNDKIEAKSILGGGPNDFNNHEDFDNNSEYFPSWYEYASRFLDFELHNSFENEFFPFYKKRANSKKL